MKSCYSNWSIFLCRIIFDIWLINWFFTLDLEWCPTGEFSIQRNHLLGVIPEWGPAWKISFELNILSFNNGGAEWGTLLRFTTTTNNCCSSVGDRIPGLFTRDNNRLQYATNINNDNTNLYSPDMLTGKYSLEIEQKFSFEYEQVKIGIKY